MKSNGNSVKPNNISNEDWNAVIAKIKTLDSKLSESDVIACAIYLHLNNVDIKEAKVTAEALEGAKNEVKKGKYVFYGVAGAIAFLVLGGLGYMTVKRKTSTIRSPRL